MQHESEADAADAKESRTQPPAPSYVEEGAWRRQLDAANAALASSFARQSAAESEHRQRIAMLEADAERLESANAVSASAITVQAITI